MTKKTTRDLNRVLSELRDQLHLFSNTPFVQEEDEAACNADTAAAVGDLPQYAALGAARLSGELYCLSEPFTPPVNLGDRPWFPRAVSSNTGFGVGDYERGTPAGEPSLGVGRVVL